MGAIQNMLHSVGPEGSMLAEMMDIILGANSPQPALNPKLAGAEPNALGLRSAILLPEDGSLYSPTRSEPEPAPTPTSSTKISPDAELSVDDAKIDTPVVGKTVDEAIAMFGKPKGRLVSGNEQVLYFAPGKHLYAADGVVTEEKDFKVKGVTEGESQPDQPSPFQKMLMAEELLSKKRLTPRGAEILRARVTRQLVNEGLDPELAGAWTANGYAGVSDYFKNKRESAARAGLQEGKVGTLEEDQYNKFLQELASLRDVTDGAGKTRAKTLEKESKQDVWKRGGVNDAAAITAILMRPQYANLVANPPAALVPTIQQIPALLQLHKQYRAKLGMSPEAGDSDMINQAEAALAARRAAQ